MRGRGWGRGRGARGGARAGRSSGRSRPPSRSRVAGASPRGGRGGARRLGRRARTDTSSSSEEEEEADAPSSFAEDRSSTRSRSARSCVRRRARCASTTRAARASSRTSASDAARSNAASASASSGSGRGAGRVASGGGGGGAGDRDGSAGPGARVKNTGRASSESEPEASSSPSDAIVGMASRVAPKSASRSRRSESFTTENPEGGSLGSAPIAPYARGDLGSHRTPRLTGKANGRFESSSAKNSIRARRTFQHPAAPPALESQLTRRGGRFGEKFSNGREEYHQNSQGVLSLEKCADVCFCQKYETGNALGPLSCPRATAHP